MHAPYVAHFISLCFSPCYTQAALLKRQQQLDAQDAKADQSLGSDDSITGYHPHPPALPFINLIQAPLTQRFRLHHDNVDAAETRPKA